MNKKQPGELKDRPQAGILWRNVMMGVIVACFVAAFVYSLLAVVAYVGVNMWVRHSEPYSLPTNSSQPQK